MFEKWAISCAHQIKKINPEETEPLDVLVFGFTILFNLLFTFLSLMLVGWLLGIPVLILQITLSFMLLRILTGGAHLDKSLACSITSLVLLTVVAWLPASTAFIYSYMILTLILLLRYAPYYEPHQVKHSKQWEQKKKKLAILWVFANFVIFYFFKQHGFLFGALLQALLLTPAGIAFTHKLNNITSKGGDIHEKSS